MAKAKEQEVLKDEKVLQSEEVTDAKEAVNAEKDGKEDITVPIGLLTPQGDEHVPVCVNGKIYQVAVGETVRVPHAVAEVLKNAMKQKTKVDRMIKAKSGKSVEINS